MTASFVAWETFQKQNTENTGDTVCRFQDLEVSCGDLLPGRFETELMRDGCGEGGGPMWES